MPRRPPFAVALVVLLMLTACVNHPIGAARALTSYEAKASTTAESALSAVETSGSLPRGQ